MELLRSLCQIHGPAGSEFDIAQFILSYIKENQKNWACQPEILSGESFQDSIMLVFGNPRTAVFAHMDTVGFTVGYDNELIKIGGTNTEGDWELVGRDSRGKIEGMLIRDGESFKVSCGRKVDRGTTLTFKPHFQDTEHFIQSPYMDNRLGVWNALKLAEKLENGIIAFSCWEEHGGGSVQLLAKHCYEGYGVKQALISDITWVTEGVRHGDGVAISLRDRGVPRRTYLNKILALAKESDIPYQIEVESAGGSDGNVLQITPYPIDWCFVGAPESHVHSPLEKVHKGDIQAMQDMYTYLMSSL